MEKKNDILIGNPNKSGYIPRITQAFKTQPLLAALAMFLPLRAPPRTAESPLKAWITELLGTQVPPISDLAKNLSFHFFEHEERDLGLLTFLFHIPSHSCLETGSNWIHNFFKRVSFHERGNLQTEEKIWTF